MGNEINRYKQQFNRDGFDFFLKILQNAIDKVLVKKQFDELVSKDDVIWHKDVANFQNGRGHFRVIGRFQEGTAKDTSFEHREQGRAPSVNSEGKALPDNILQTTTADWSIHQLINARNMVKSFRCNRNIKGNSSTVNPLYKEVSATDVNNVAEEDWASRLSKTLNKDVYSKDAKEKQKTPGTGNKKNSIEESPTVVLPPPQRGYLKKENTVNLTKIKRTSFLTRTYRSNIEEKNSPKVKGPIETVIHQVSFLTRSYRKGTRDETPGVTRFPSLELPLDLKDLKPLKRKKKKKNGLNKKSEPEGKSQKESVQYFKTDGWSPFGYLPLSGKKLEHFAKRYTKAHRHKVIKWGNMNMMLFTDTVEHKPFIAGRILPVNKLEDVI